MVLSSSPSPWARSHAADGIKNCCPLAALVACRRLHSPTEGSEAGTHHCGGSMTARTADYLTCRADGSVGATRDSAKQRSWLGKR
eukprot:scaffold7885_cov403-Prasinococcus_capsulatus_cf.AAC.4